MEARIRVKHPKDTVNFCVVQLPKCDLAFSYETLIGVRQTQTTGLSTSGSWQWVLSQNNWGPTTGKHLNWLDNDKDTRVPHAELLRIAKHALSGFGYADLVAAAEDAAKSLENL
jgi:hypothetical protein